MKLAGVVLGISLLAIPQRSDASDRVFWEGAYRRSTNVALAGAITGGAGFTLLLGGATVGDPDTAALGALGWLAGAPIMAAGSLRGCRALRELNRPVSPAAGYIAWGMFGGSIVLSLVYQESTNFTAALIGAIFGAYSAAGLQMVFNTIAWRGYRRPPPPRPPPRTFRVELVPAPNGLALVGKW